MRVLALPLMLTILAMGLVGRPLVDLESPVANGQGDLPVSVSVPDEFDPIVPYVGDGQPGPSQNLVFPSIVQEQRGHFQTYGSPITGAAPMTQQSPAEFPNRALVYIHVGSLPDDCTGFMYGPDIVATAGHCVALGGNGYFADATTVLIHPAYDMRDSQFGECRAKRLYSTVGWVRRGDRRFDYGAVRLDCRVGNHTGWLGMSRGDLLPMSTAVQISGYADQSHPPCKTLVAGHPRPCSGAGDVRAFGPGRVFYFASTYQMMSGSPVTVPLRNPAVAISIHAYSFNSRATGPDARYNSGTLLTPRRLRNFGAWRTGQ